MAQFEETKEQQSIYTLFRCCVYLILILELVVNLPVLIDEPITAYSLGMIVKLGFFNSPAWCKVMELICVSIVCVGTQARKDLKFSWKKNVIIPLSVGATALILSLLFESVSHSYLGDGPLPPSRWLYAICSVVGLVLVHMALDAMAKKFNSKLGQDRFNFENESFPQSRQKVENEYSVNIPMFFYLKKKMHEGWINITNPFRGTIVLGTPGSGKSFGVIDPFIRQHSAKGFAMMVYDYKYPTLARNLFYQFLKNRRAGKTPNNCSFRVVNFSDVRYSNRINPIQRKYIPDLASASETAATLIASLNKGGGEKKGGSEAFFTNSAENFLAAIIYFFVTLHPTGYKDGKRLKRYALINGDKALVEWKGLNSPIATARGCYYDFIGTDGNGNAVNYAKRDRGRLSDLKDVVYFDPGRDCWVKVTDVWYEDDKGRRVDADYITGFYSSMPHVLSFLGNSYEHVFNILMRVPNIMSLMAPFKSAYDNKANDQLEGMVGTLRVNAARLVSPEAYWIFSGDEFDLKISDPRWPCYLVIANDPEKEQVIGSLNALILNRLIARINSKGNIPVSIIVDELPTLYFHKIDRLIGTARSNKVAVTLGFQELPQLEADYGKVGMHKIISTCGNILAGAARNKETLEWLSNDVFGKVKQLSESVTIDQARVSRTISEKMDALLPAAKIADMATGWLAGQTARDFFETSKKAFNSIDLEEDSDFKTTKYFCKTNFDMDAIKCEEKAFVDIPEITHFKSPDDMEMALLENFDRINAEIQALIEELYIKSDNKKD